MAERYVTALLRLPLNDRKLDVPEFFDFLGLAIEVVIRGFRESRDVTQALAA